MADGLKRGGQLACCASQQSVTGSDGCFARSSGSTASTSGIPLWSGSWRHYSTRQKVGQTYRVTQSTGIPRKGEQGDGPPERQPSTQPLPEGADVVVPMDALTTPPDIGKHSLFTMVGGELTRSGYAESIGASSVQERLRVKLRKEPAAAGDKGPSSSSSSLSPGPQGAAAAASKPIDFFSLSGTGVLDTGLTLESPAARPQLGEEARTILQKIVGHLTKEVRRPTDDDACHWLLTCAATRLTQTLNVPSF